MDKPPVAPKPKVVLAKPTEPSNAPKYEPHLTVSQPQIKTVKAILKPHLFDIHTLPLRAKSVTATNGPLPHSQQGFEKPGHSGLSNSRNGFEHRTGISNGQSLGTANDFVHDSSGDKPTLKRVTLAQSYGTVKRNQSTNGSENFEKLPGSDQVSSLHETGLPLEISDSKHVLVNNMHHGYPAMAQTSHLPPVPVRKPPPVPVQKSSSSIGQQMKSDIRLQESEGPVKTRRKVLTMNERTITTFKKEGSATVSPRKRIETERRPRIDIQHNNVKPPISSPTWKGFPADRNQKQELPSPSFFENATWRRPGTNLKPKNNSFSPGDKFQNDAPKKPTFKIIRELDLSVKISKIFSKPDFSIAKDEVDEDCQANSNRTELYAKIPQYRTHQVRLQNELTFPEKFSRPVFTREQSVDGEDVSDAAVENEHLYEEITNVSVLNSQRRQPTERLLSNDTADEYGKPNFYDRSSKTSSRQEDELCR